MPDLRIMSDFFQDIVLRCTGLIIIISGFADDTAWQTKAHHEKVGIYPTAAFRTAWARLKCCLFMSHREVLSRKCVDRAMQRYVRDK